MSNPTEFRFVKTPAAFDDIGIDYFAPIYQAINASTNTSAFSPVPKQEQYTSKSWKTWQRTQAYKHSEESRADEKNQRV